MKKNRRPIGEHVLCIVLIVLICVTNSIWIWQETSPPLWDIAGHSQRSLYVAQLLNEGKMLEILRFDTIYPPLPYLVTAALFFVSTLFGNIHSDIPQYSLLLWNILLIVSLYSCTLSFFPKRFGVASISIVLLFCYPLLLHFSRIYDLDLPLTAIVTAAYASFMRTEFLLNRKWVVVSALLCALALLTKWTAIIFLVTPLCILLGASLVRNRTHRASQDTRTILIHSAIAIGVIALIAGPWYLLHAETIIHSAADTRANIFSVPYENIFSFQNALYYLKKIVESMTWPLALGSIAGIAVIIIKRHQYRWVLLTSIIVPYLFLTFGLYSKESRYSMPLLPLLALGTVSLVALVEKRIMRITIASLLSVVALFFWVETSWGVHLLPATWYDTLHFSGMYGYQRITPQKPRYGFTMPTQYATPLNEVVDAIHNDIARSSQIAGYENTGVIQIAVIPNSLFLTAQQVQYFGRLSGLETVDAEYRIDYTLSSFVRQGDWESTIVAAEYLITKNGDQGPKIWGPNLKKIAAREKEYAPPFDQFELIHTWPLAGIEQETSTMRLYRHR